LTSIIKFDKIVITKNIDKEMYVKMKSRKLKAVLAAVSAIAVLATAMTGFAAATVVTTTRYNCGDNFAQVTTTVSGLAKEDAEVTLKVTSGGGDGVNASGISYIDQQTAEGGIATFEYTIDKTLIGTATDVAVSVGNDCEDAIDAGALGVGTTTGTKGNYYNYQPNDPNVVYAGTETVLSSFSLGQKAIDAGAVGFQYIKVNDKKYYGFNAVPVEYVGGVPSLPSISSNVDPITLHFVMGTTATYTLQSADPITNGDSSVSTPILLSSASGNVQELGVIYDGVRYPSLDVANRAAVITLVPAAGDTIDTAKITPYYMVNDICYDESNAVIAQ